MSVRDDKRWKSRRERYGEIGDIGWRKLTSFTSGSFDGAFLSRSATSQAFRTGTAPLDTAGATGAGTAGPFGAPRAPMLTRPIAAAAARGRAGVAVEEKGGDDGVTFALDRDDFVFVVQNLRGNRVM